jgi:ribose transport system permease protein
MKLKLFLQKAGQVLIQRSVVILFVLLFALFSITVGDIFISSINLQNVARQISFDLPVALSMTTVLIAGGLDLSVGSVMSMAAALTMGLQSHGTWFAVLAALAFGVAVGAANGLLVTRGGIVPFIATLGTMTLVNGIMLTYTRQAPIAGHDESFTFWGSGSLGPIPVPFVIVTVMLIVLHTIYRFTKLGRNFYASGGNQDAAYLAGINVARSRFITYLISGFMAAVAGVLLSSLLNSSSPHIGLDTPLWAIAASIMGGASLLGGRGTAIGTLFGVLSLGVLANGMNLVGIQTYFQIGIKALILILVVGLDAVLTQNQRKRLMRTMVRGTE